MQATFQNAVAEAGRDAEGVTAEEGLHGDEELFGDSQLACFAGATIDFFVVSQLNLAVVESGALAEGDVFLGFQGAADFQHVGSAWVV
ncbi:hypothetical protein D3C76_1740250 [compost metagenome]